MKPSRSGNFNVVCCPISIIARFATIASQVPSNLGSFLIKNPASNGLTRPLNDNPTTRVRRKPPNARYLNSLVYYAGPSRSLNRADFPNFDSWVRHPAMPGPSKHWALAHVSATNKCPNSFMRGK